MAKKGFIKKTLLILLLLAFFVPAFSFALTPTQEREQLEAELQVLEDEIEAIEGDITKTQAEKRTLQNLMLRDNKGLEGERPTAS